MASGTSGAIQITVVGGYLGAGKTTLLNHMLRSSDERVAVMVNDFGSINIDADLIAAHDGDTITLTNGCICCSMVDGFGAALDEVRSRPIQPERIIVEASGVADPASVAAYAHSPGLALDAIIVVADAETIRDKVADRYVGDVVRNQLAAADIILLNKTDLVTPDSLVQVTAWLDEHWPSAVVISCVSAAVPTEILFDRPHQGVLQPRDTLSAQNVFSTWTFTSDSPLERAVVEQLMADLPDTIVRMKGIVFLDTAPGDAVVLQRVGRRWSLQPSDLKQAEPTSRIVAIGLTDAISDSWLKRYFGR